MVSKRSPSLLITTSKRVVFGLAFTLHVHYYVIRDVLLLIHSGEYRTDMVWFLASLPCTEYIISSESVLNTLWTCPRQSIASRRSSIARISKQSKIGGVYLYITIVGHESTPGYVQDQILVLQGGRFLRQRRYSNSFCPKNRARDTPIPKHQSCVQPPGGSDS